MDTNEKVARVTFDHELPHSKAKGLVQAHRQANKEKVQAHSKDNLKRHITTKFKTTMIGDLDRVEKMFGDLWGAGLQEDQLTDEQYELRKKWNLLRTDMLNNGNNQLRAALSEIDNYTVEYNKNLYNFVVKKGTNNE